MKGEELQERVRIGRDYAATRINHYWQLSLTRCDGDVLDACCRLTLDVVDVAPIIMASALALGHEFQRPLSSVIMSLIHTAHFSAILSL